MEGVLSILFMTIINPLVPVFCLKLFLLTNVFSKIRHNKKISAPEGSDPEPGTPWPIVDRIRHRIHTRNRNVKRILHTGLSYTVHTCLQFSQLRYRNAPKSFWLGPVCDLVYVMVAIPWKILLPRGKHLRDAGWAESPYSFCPGKTPTLHLLY